MTFLENYADRLVFFLSMALVFIPLERLLPRNRKQRIRRPNLKMDLAYMLLGGIATTVLATFVITIVVALFAGVVPEAVRNLVSAQPLWLQMILILIAGDFWYYWMHRLFHTVPTLWKYHAVHHSIEEMDWIAAHRTHPLDTAITNSGFMIVVLLFDFSLAAYAIFAFQFSCHSLLKHSNVKVGWGIMRWLYVTPTFHHWHHANEKDAYDKNFAAQFPGWDILFGTALMGRADGPRKYGVDDPVPSSFLGSLIYPFRAIQPAAHHSREEIGSASQSIDTGAAHERGLPQSR